jgi:hypothetical protein
MNLNFKVSKLGGFQLQSVVYFGINYHVTFKCNLPNVTINFIYNSKC